MAGEPVVKALAVTVLLDLAVGARQVGLFLAIGALTVYALRIDPSAIRLDRFEDWQLWLLGFGILYVVWAVGLVARRNGGWLV